MDAAVAFGLEVRSDRRLPFLRGVGAGRGDRRLALSLVDAAALDDEWPDGAELICDERLPDGDINFQIERASTHGYRLWGPSYGTAVVSADGFAVRGALGADGLAGWQRFLVAQALPFAAVLQGLEVLHASAVVCSEGAVAFLGPSGAGKTSLAFELCARGASFLADDVLALEASGDDVIAFPGAPIAGIAAAEAERLAAEGGLGGFARLGGDEREQVVEMSPYGDSVPLRALFFLSRRPGGAASPHFEPVLESRALLSATFNLLLTDPPRLERLLDVAAKLAARRVERLVCGTQVGVAELADAVEARIGIAA